MGESTDSRTTLRFDRRLRLEFHGSTITSDAGLLACRELDDALGLTETATACLQESRGGRNVQHQLVALLRQSVYIRLAGYEDTNDAERLAQDPAMRVIVGRRGLEKPLWTWCWKITRCLVLRSASSTEAFDLGTPGRRRSASPWRPLGRHRPSPGPRRRCSDRRPPGFV